MVHGPRATDASSACCASVSSPCVDATLHWFWLLTQCGRAWLSGWVSTEEPGGHG